jgi:hypothetical protein
MNRNNNIYRKVTDQLEGPALLTFYQDNSLCFIIFAPYPPPWSNKYPVKQVSGQTSIQSNKYPVKQVSSQTSILPHKYKVISVFGRTVITKTQCVYLQGLLNDIEKTCD